MPRLEIDGRGGFDVEAGTRLVNAIEANGVEILHRCGGFAKCTTCRVEFSAGEPDTMTVAEHDKLEERELLGKVRLSCQMLCDHDMALKVVYTLAESGLPDPGSAPEAQITPEPEWRDAPAA